METTRYTVSVVMCTYNGEKYLREQLDSILTQTYPIFEIIIQDDRSTDSTFEICREYESQHSNIRLYENKINLGFNHNFKSAAMKATGDFVAFSDQDDIWFPTKIEKQIAAIGEHDICFTTHLRGGKQEESHLVSPQYTFLSNLFQGFAGHTMLLRKEFIQQESSWTDYIIYDWALIISAHLGRGIIRVEEPLNWHRSHEDSAASELHRKFYPHEKENTNYEPLLHGPSNYFKLQRKENWKKLYQHIYDHTDKIKFPLEHKTCKLLLDEGKWTSLIRLCFICLKHYKTIYPDRERANKTRGVLYPFIFAYHNTNYDL